MYKEPPLLTPHGCRCSMSFPSLRRQALRRYGIVHVFWDSDVQQRIMDLGW